MASGSEVALCLEAHERLKAEGIKSRVVSMPSWELFHDQPREYRDSVLPPEVTARVSVEQASTFGWATFVGLTGHSIGMRSFGASAPLKDLVKKFGFTPEHIIAAAKEQIALSRRNGMQLHWRRVVMRGHSNVSEEHCSSLTLEYPLVTTAGGLHNFIQFRRDRSICSFAAAMTCSGVKPNFFTRSFSGADDRKDAFPMLCPVRPRRSPSRTSRPALSEPAVTSGGSSCLGTPAADRGIIPMTACYHPDCSVGFEPLMHSRAARTSLPLAISRTSQPAFGA